MLMKYAISAGKWLSIDALDGSRGHFVTLADSVDKLAAEEVMVRGQKRPHENNCLPQKSEKTQGRQRS